MAIGNWARWISGAGQAGLFCGWLLLAAPAAAAPALGSYNAPPSSVSVSGLSSGAFMAGQLGVAYSAKFPAGVGLFAGGLYDCAGQRSYSQCMYTQTPPINTSITNMRAWSGGSIDSISHLAAQKLYLFSGGKDTTVGTSVMDQTYKLYATEGAFVPAASVRYDKLASAAHTFPTDFDSAGNNACNSAVSPYISNCGFDGAGAVLQQIYGPLNARNTGNLSGSLVQFDQATFVSGGNGMDTTAWVYLPAACQAGEVCQVHVALHGCKQYQGAIGTKFVSNTGYNKWADTNRIIVLYPQTVADNTTHATAASGSLSNPNGCWDWIGWYGGSSFDKKGGVQMAAIVAMVDRLTAGYQGGSAPASPSGLATTGNSTNSISLAWSGVTGAASYGVYRDGNRVGTAGTTSYTDGGLAAGTTYVYAVTAVNAHGESAPSASVSASTSNSGGAPPATPAGLSGSSPNSSAVNLSWTSSAGATSYRLYRNGNQVASIAGTSYSDSGLTAATTYRYAVSAANASGESARSSEITVTTQAAPACFTASNYDHVRLGRAHVSWGYALANGSNQNMGLYNIFVRTTLKQTGSNYYLIGTCP